MKSIFITFAGILVFFAALSFNVSAGQFDRTVASEDAVANQVFDGKASERRFKDDAADSGC